MPGMTTSVMIRLNKRFSLKHHDHLAGESQCFVCKIKELMKVVNECHTKNR